MRVSQDFSLSIRFAFISGQKDGRDSFFGSNQFEVSVGSFVRMQSTRSVRVEMCGKSNSK